MPYYEHICRKHGIFEDFRPMSEAGVSIPCPICHILSERLISMPSIKIVNKKRLPLGEGSPGRMITSAETGGLDIFVPSYGAMEQAEVDYVAGEAIEKEKARVSKVKKQGARNENQARIGAYADLARRTPKGQRAKVLREAIRESGDNIKLGG